MKNILYKKLNKILLYKKKLIIFQILRIEIIFCHYNDLFIKYFNINKMVKLIAKKYYWLLFKIDIKKHINRYNIYLKINLFTIGFIIIYN